MVFLIIDLFSYIYQYIYLGYLFFKWIFFYLLNLISYCLNDVGLLIIYIFIYIYQ